MNLVTWVRGLLTPTPIARPATGSTTLPNLPVHPNYSGSAAVRQ